MRLLLALLAFVVLLGFLVILILKVPSPDLVGVVLLTAALAGYDLIDQWKRRD